jgi:hypothetical protein
MSVWNLADCEFPTQILKNINFAEMNRFTFGRNKSAKNKSVERLGLE